MITEHKIINKNSKNMGEIKNNSVDLIVTSPPYPMIEMWDNVFSKINKNIKQKLDNKKPEETFELMHKELDKTWMETKRVIKTGGIICINIGDATRKINEKFQLFSNHTRVIDFFQKQNFTILPDILWHKPSNKPNKFMGSGMLPPNAYATLEHEYILFFRKGKNRKINNEKQQLRYQSAYFWEERNIWFSDIWNDLKGTTQKIKEKENRNRSAAFPFELPHRIINMYSIIGDTVLDPFWGTGTTSLAAINNARNSIGYELDEKLIQLFNKKLKNIEKKVYENNKNRIQSHIEFIENRDTKHKSENYDFKVITNQEKQIMFYDIERIEQKNNQHHIVYHKKHRPVLQEKIKIC